MGFVVSVACVGLAAQTTARGFLRRVYAAKAMVGDAPIAVGRVDGIANARVVGRLSL